MKLCFVVTVMAMGEVENQGVTVTEVVAPTEIHMMVTVRCDDMRVIEIKGSSKKRVEKIVNKMTAAKPTT